MGQSVEKVKGRGGMIGRLVAWDSFALYRTTTPRMQSRQSDALEARSVTHQIKGEDGALTGIQQVRPTLFHMSSCFFSVSSF